MGELLPIGEALDMSAIRQRAERHAREAARNPKPPQRDWEAERVAELARATTDERWTKVPERYRHARVDDLDGDAATLAARWDQSSNVLLLGSVGVGKTHMACALAHAAWKATACHVLFWSTPLLLDAMRPGRQADALERAIKVDLLVLDDIGTERPTDWTGEQLAMIVAARYDAQRPTVVTSNLNPDSLVAAIGERAYSRLYHGAERLQVAGGDRRRGGAA